MTTVATKTTNRSSDTQEELVSKINERLGKHRGEFALLVETKEEFFGCTGFGHHPEPHDYHLVTRLYLGVISGSTLITQNQFFRAIPTDTYAFCWDLEQREVEKIEGNLRPHHGFLLLCLDKPIKAKNSLFADFARLSGKKLVELELYIGDEEISAWTGDDQAWTGDDQDNLLVLGKMAKLLGRKLPQAIEPQVKEAVAKEKQAALRNIARVFDEYLALLRKIRLRGKPEDVRVSSLSVSEESELLISAREAALFGPLGKMCEDLEDLERQLQFALKKAHQLGLRQKEIAAALARQYEQMLVAVLGHIWQTGHKKKT